MNPLRQIGLRFGDAANRAKTAPAPAGSGILSRRSTSVAESAPNTSLVNRSRWTNGTENGTSTADEALSESLRSEGSAVISKAVGALIDFDYDAPIVSRQNGN